MPANTLYYGDNLVIAEEPIGFPLSEQSPQPSSGRLPGEAPGDSLSHGPTPHGLVVAEKAR